MHYFMRFSLGTRAAYLRISSIVIILAMIPGTAWSLAEYTGIYQLNAQVIDHSKFGVTVPKGAQCADEDAVAGICGANGFGQHTEDFFGNTTTSGIAPSDLSLFVDITGEAQGVIGTPAHSEAWAQTLGRINLQQLPGAGSRTVDVKVSHEYSILAFIDDTALENSTIKIEFKSFVNGVFKDTFTDMVVANDAKVGIELPNISLMPITLPANPPGSAHSIITKLDLVISIMGVANSVKLPDPLPNVEFPLPEFTELRIPEPNTLLLSAFAATGFLSCVRRQRGK